MTSCLLYFFELCKGFDDTCLEAYLAGFLVISTGFEERIKFIDSPSMSTSTTTPPPSNDRSGTPSTASTVARNIVGSNYDPN